MNIQLLITFSVQHKFYFIAFKRLHTFITINLCSYQGNSAFGFLSDVCCFEVFTIHCTFYSSFWSFNWDIRRPKNISASKLCSSKGNRSSSILCSNSFSKHRCWRKSEFDGERDGKLNVFENDCLWTTEGISCTENVNMDAIRSDLEVRNKIPEIFSKTEVL